MRQRFSTTTASTTVATLVTGAMSPYLLAMTVASSTAWPALAAAVSCVGLLTWRRQIGRRNVLGRVTQLVCLYACGFLATTLHINERLASRLPAHAERTLHSVTGTIGSLPQTIGDAVRFVFLPDPDSSPVAGRIRVYWYQRGPDNGPPALWAGDRWRLQLELKVPRGYVNFSGMDAERWLFAEGIGALGLVRPGDNARIGSAGVFDLQHRRENVLQALAAKAGHVPEFRLIAALAIADRRSLQKRDRDIFAATGTGHLLAISGLHIGLAAAIGFYLGKCVLLFLPYGLHQRAALGVPWSGAWILALVYAALAGFGVSAQRALIMFSVITIVALSRRRVQPSLPFVLALFVVLLADPLAPLRPGFRFSFGAVAVLLGLFTPRHGVSSRWRQMLIAQLGISLCMAPVGMYWFQQSSLPGLLANLVAIPVISFVVVPLILLALLLLWLPGSLSVWLLGAAGYTLHWLLLFLDHLAELQPALLSATRAPGLLATLLAVAGALMIILPRGAPARYAGPLLMLPMYLPASPAIPENGALVDFLDVGQGLSVLVGDRKHLLLYDTGPGNGQTGQTGWDLVRGVVRPMITARGQHPDRLVVSHGDLDHAGGLDHLRAIFPSTQVLANLPVEMHGVEQCHAPFYWSAGNLEFNVLHPSSGFPYLGNDSSCVVSVTAPGFSLLLSGDISHVVERRLVAEGLAPHTFVTAPHHGSSTSSSAAFLDALKPSIMLVSAGAGNRFGFPREDVLTRYDEVRATMLNTADCGGIRIAFRPGIRADIKSARLHRPAIWRWPAGDGCP